MNLESQKYLTKLSILFLLALICPGCRREGLNQDLSAEAIMDAIKNAYRKCATYQDDGTQAEKYILPETMNPVMSQYRLRYDRHRSEFAFAYLQPHRSYVVKQSAAVVQSFDSESSEPQRRDSLVSALHIANGVSNGTALLISPLLEPEKVDRSSFWSDITQLQRIPDEDIDGVPHYRLQGDFSGASGTVDIWVAHDFCIQRIVTREPAMHELQRTWNLNAKMNAPLHVEAFSVEALRVTDLAKPLDGWQRVAAKDPNSTPGLLQTFIDSTSDQAETASAAIRARGVDALPVLFEVYVDARPYIMEPGFNFRGIAFKLNKLLFQANTNGDSGWEPRANEEIHRRLVSLQSHPVSWMRLQAAFDMCNHSIATSGPLPAAAIQTLGKILDSDVRYQRRQALIALEIAIGQWPMQCEFLVPRLADLAEDELFALNCLSKLGRHAKAAIPRLKQLRTNANPPRRSKIDEVIQIIESS